MYRDVLRKVIGLNLSTEIQIFLHVIVLLKDICLFIAFHVYEAPFF